MTLLAPYHHGKTDEDGEGWPGQGTAQRVRDQQRGGWRESRGVIETIGRRLTEPFWEDFGRRVAQEKRGYRFRTISSIERCPLLF